MSFDWLGGKGKRGYSAEFIPGCRTTTTFAAQLLAGRWFMVFASLLIMSVAGATYLFGLYSGDIKSSLGYDQSTLNLLSFFKDLGGNVGIISGLINEITPPWVVLSIGAVTNFFGYFMIWLAVTGRITKPQIWHMCIYICAGANSQAFANTGALVTCVKNFPESRGVVLGLLKGFVGLSGAIITQIFHAIYGHDNKSLILLIAWLPAFISIIFLKTIRIIKIEHHPNEIKLFYKILYISLALAGFLMVIIILQNILTFNKFEYFWCATIVTILLFSPIFLVIKQELDLSKLSKLLSNVIPDPKVVIDCLSEKETPLTTTHASETKHTPCFTNILKPPARGEDYTILQALFSLDMLALFATTTFGVGGTLTAIDNLGQIGDSLGYPKESITTFISLVSIWNYLGRVFSGFVSEILLKKYKFPRPLMLTFVLLFSCCGHLLIAFGVPNSLYVSSVIMGFCFGAQWPLIFAIISELFGLKYYSTLYNFGAGASPVGAYVLNVRIAGQFYDQEALKQLAAKGLTRADGEDLTCTGVECYKMAFLIITGATLFGCLVSFILVLRTRKFYRSDIYKKFREIGETGEVEMDSGISRPIPVPASDPGTQVKEQEDRDGDNVKNNR